MLVRRPGLWIGLLALALTGQASATDLPLKPARPAPVKSTPAAAKPAGPDATCLEWTDGCRVCQRTGGEVSCSNVGIACVPKTEECTRR